MSIESAIENNIGCGGVMRIAPVGLMMGSPFKIASEIAYITHRHPTEYLSLAFFAELVSNLKFGLSLLDAIDASTEKLIEHPDHEKTLNAIKGGLELSDKFDPSPETIEQLGTGWSTEEALAISLFCSIKAESFKDGVLMAVNHGGNSDSTGGITGSILGMIYGIGGIPNSWIEQLEVKDIIYEMADDAMTVLKMPSEDLFGEENPDKEQEAMRRILLKKYPPN